MNVSTTTVIDIAAPRTSVFDFVLAEDLLLKILSGYGPIPRVVRTRVQTEQWGVVGASRLVFFGPRSDWHPLTIARHGQLHEEITAIDHPRYFAYRVSNFSFIMKRFVSEGTGQWWFAEQKSGTRITWRYTFRLKSPLFAPIMWPFIGLIFRGYMRVGLQATKDQTEIT